MSAAVCYLSQTSAGPVGASVAAAAAASVHAHQVVVSPPWSVDWANVYAADGNLCECVCVCASQFSFPTPAFVTCEMGVRMWLCLRATALQNVCRRGVCALSVLCESISVCVCVCCLCGSAWCVCVCFIYVHRVHNMRGAADVRGELPHIYRTCGMPLLCVLLCLWCLWLCLCAKSGTHRNEHLPLAARVLSVFQ